TVWLDGAQQTTKSLPAPFRTLDPARVEIGYQNTVPNRFWNGYRADWAIGNGVLSSGDRTVLYTAQSGATVVDPTADAGDDQNAVSGEWVTLDASGSTEGGGAAIVSYVWRESGTIVAEGQTAYIRFGTLGAHTLT